MKKKLKIIAILLITIVSITALAGCAKRVENSKNYNTVLSKGNRIIANSGLVLQAWVPSAESSERCISAADLAELGFGPSYYDGNMFNEIFHSDPNSLWSLAKAPNGGNAMSASPNGQEWLSDEQLKYAKSLISVCFGDEQEYSKGEVEKLKAWFSDFNSRHPDTMVHSNQYCGQWSNREVNYYVKTAKPDILTYDLYYFQEIKENAIPDYKMPAFIAECINYVRLPAMAGHDGSGKSPIPFGQYLLGYKTGINQASVGKYEITESQMNFVANLALTMGGKWLDIFRIILGENFLFFDDEGNKTKHFKLYSELAKEMMNISDHIKKLQTTTVEVIQGRHLEKRGEKNNVLPKNINKFSKNKAFNLDGITVKNMGTENNGLNGDVYVGFFDTLPTMSFDGGKERDYFIVCNGLATGNATPVAEQNGSSDETKQEITMKITNNNGKTLYSVDSLTGEIEKVTIENGEYKYEMGGGKLKVFYWE